ncbi:MAG TPA: PIN domain-containing protein [Candidatus Nanoarchaeia archaeon]|nr:PIN domain-containing protein [Candidatus Nanoarchaeia archaeon]
MEKIQVLDTSLLIEHAEGLTTVFSIIEYPPAIKSCTIIMPEKEDFAKAIELASQLRLKGTPIGCTDIIIASMCINRKLKLLTKDKDYKYIKEIDKTFQVEFVS